MMNPMEKKLQLERAKKFFYRLPQHFFGETRTFEAEIALTDRRLAYAQIKHLPFHKIAGDEFYGKLWDKAYVKLRGSIPPEWRGCAVSFLLNFGGEALMFDRNGSPVCGFTSTCVFEAEYKKELHHHTLSAEPEELELLFEVQASGNLGAETNFEKPGVSCEVGVMRQLKYGVFHPEVWHLRLEFEILLALVGEMRQDVNCIANTRNYPADSYFEHRIYRVMMLAVDAYKDDPANAPAARAVLRQILGQTASSDTMRAAAVGHCHIDIAWLWTIDETIGKVGRTFANQLSLLRRHPDYIFGESQPFLYELAKEHYPELFEEVKAYVKAGRWELQGGMYVEADCNLSSGEALVRQFLYGKNFFRDEFGVEVKNLWLPDVFGYNAMLPQLSRLAGCDSFVTQKLCWNQYNKFPYHAFTWYGLDGTGLLTFFPPEENYNAMLVPDQLNFGANNLSENDILDEFLCLYGVGDGGGGPKDEYLERARLCADLSGCPKVSFSRADDFLARLARRQNELPEYHGELYLECHRGTYTSQGWIKKANRECEQLLIGAEFILSQLPASDYPRGELDRLWKKLLVNQFHDILPGSSIGRVYEDARQDYALIRAKVTELLGAAARQLYRSNFDSCLLVNTLSCNYEQLIDLPGGKRLVTLPPGGAVELPPDRPVPDPETAANDLVLQNELICYTFDRNGLLVSARDLECGREIMRAGGNRLSLYVDMPVANEAWDIDLAYENEKICEAALTGYSPKRIARDYQEFDLEFTIGQSTVRQQVTLANGSKRLEFHNVVDYRERRKMLRVAFDTVIDSDEAAFDIQFGHIRRPTHRNTSRERAMYEVAAQRYMDLSESNYGVALLNDGKYGCKVLGGTLDLNLLRSPIWPDENADLGAHEFAYCFLPHCHALADSQVMAEAAAFNRPPFRFDHFALSGAEVAPVAIIRGAASLEALKRAQKSDALIARVVESAGCSGEVELAVPAGARVFVTDLLEWHTLSELDNRNGRVVLPLHKFEIVSLCIKA